MLQGVPSCFTKLHRRSRSKIMSANTTIYVLVIKEVASWVEVSAATLAMARVIAKEHDGDVVRVVKAQYECPHYGYGEEV